ncbi:hypothetical protein IFM89_027785 [Coptis chinensis]|uniref:Uncharacterized protein n=1 Tax=Coptis chinensis TaxID=261450 RepID=A0A835I424_9MAGN|nr:hypothetical protein IFM89_027785 [Coptis chinensis]
MGKIVKITGIKDMGRTTTVLVSGSNRLVPDEAERSLHDALCVIRCLVTKKFLILWWWCLKSKLSRRLGLNPIAIVDELGTDMHREGLLVSIENTSIGSTDITDMWGFWKKAKIIASQSDESYLPQAPHQDGLCGAALGFILSEAIVTNASMLLIAFLKIRIAWKIVIEICNPY